jgi:hypothetical protein
MSGLPKKYAKMGFKKGWMAFKKLKKHSIKRKTNRVVHIARRRKGGFKRFYKRTSRRVKSGFTFGSVSKIVLGIGLAALYEVFVSPMLPIAGQLKNIVEFAIGIALMSMSGMPSYVKSFGMALAIINGYSLVVPYISGLNGNSSSTGAWMD